MGNQPKIWNEKDSSIKRARLLVNYFTRMRYCSPKGRIKFAFKGSPENAPHNTLPWFEFWRDSTDHKILFGHWSAFPDIRVGDHIFNLDTGCAWEGKLTAYCLEASNSNAQVDALTQIKCREADRSLKLENG